MSGGSVIGKDVTASERVLVVDDDVSLCRLVCEALKQEGCDPLCCTSSEDVVEISRRNPFDLAFVDVQIFGISGLQLAEALKRQNPWREIVVMADHGTLDNAVQAVKLGGSDFLKKPFSLDEFLFCLSRHRERMAFREKLRRAEQRYTDLVQNIPMMIFVLLEDHRLEFVNRMSRTILGYAPDEIVGVPDWLLQRAYAEDRDLLAERLRQAFSAGGRPLFLECRFLHREGHLVYLLLKSIPQSPGSQAPRPPRLMGIAADITDRIFLERALVQREKVKTLGNIAAEVAHEIRNPLVSIGGFARRLQKQFPDTPEAGIVLKECRRLEKILDRIRNYLRPVELRFQDYSVEHVLSHCESLLSPEIERKQVECRREVDPSLPDLYVDPDLLLQVFINLTRNALEAMGKGDVLHVRAYSSDRQIHVQFRNPCRKGRSINSEKLFLPFDEGGQSIGLPLCYRLVKSMGGILSFAQEGEQALFTVSLPTEVDEEREVRGLRRMPLAETVSGDH